MIKILLFPITRGRDLYLKLANTHFWKNRISPFYQKFWSPIWKYLGLGVFIETYKDYGCWAKELAQLSTNPDIIASIPIHVSKTHAFIQWLYNVNLIKFFDAKIHNLCVYLQLPKIIISILFILFIIFFILWFFKKLFIFIFSYKPLPLYTEKDPETILKSLISKENNEILDLQTQITFLKSQITSLLKEKEKYENTLEKVVHVVKPPIFPTKEQELLKTIGQLENHIKMLDHFINTHIKNKY